MKIKHLLIGSRALEIIDKNFKAKDCSDYDIISSEPDELISTYDMKLEIHQPQILNNNKFLDTTHTCGSFYIGTVEIFVASREVLSIIKRSHLHRQIKFDQHITTWHKFLSCCEVDKQLLEERTRLTHLEFPQGHPKLNQHIDTFFADAVTKKYSHDWLHELYAYEDQPMYTRLQKDKTSAWCSKELWYNLHRQQKIQCVAEEAYVIATERFLVPKDWNYPAKRAYYAAVKKICTTLCSGWFRDFAIDNYPSVIEMFDEQKVNQVKSVVESQGHLHLFK